MNNFKKYLESVQLKKGIITESESSLTDEQVKEYFSKQKSLKTKKWSLVNCVFFNSLEELKPTLNKFKTPLPEQVDNSKEQYSRIIPGKIFPGEVGHSGKKDDNSKKTGLNGEFIFIVKTEDNIVVYHCVKLTYFIPTNENEEININSAMILSIPKNELSSDDYYNIEKISIQENSNIESKLEEIIKQIEENKERAIKKAERDEIVHNINRPEFQK